MDKLSYALGVNLFNVNQTLDIDSFVKGYTEAKDGNSQMPEDEMNSILQEWMQKAEKEAQQKEMEMVMKNKVDGEKFLEENKTKDGVVTTPSGLQYKVLKEGTGKQPTKNSVVKCHYEGKFINGTVFDSSYRRGTPATFGLNQVIQGWTEGVQLMKEGGMCEFYIPYNLGYGENGISGAIPGYSTLVFTVELLNVL